MRNEAPARHEESRATTSLAPRRRDPPYKGMRVECDVYYAIEEHRQAMERQVFIDTGYAARVTASRALRAICERAGIEIKQLSAKERREKEPPL